MGCLREGGFSFRDAVHAYSVQDAYIYGFALQEKYLGFETPGGVGRRRSTRSAGRSRRWTGSPYLLEVATELQTAGYDDETEFLFGLDLILDALERFRGAG